jgi:hypothetical protein
MPGADEVFLVWGIDGWLPLPAEDRPVGTVVRDGLMHTPMVREGDTFVVDLKVPIMTGIDYAFRVATRQNDGLDEMWDNNSGQNYHTTVRRAGGIIEANPSASPAQDDGSTDSRRIGLYLVLTGSILLATMSTVVLLRALGHRDSR